MGRARGAAGRRGCLSGGCAGSAGSIRYRRCAESGWRPQARVRPSRAADRLPAGAPARARASRALRQRPRSAASAASRAWHAVASPRAVARRTCPLPLGTPSISEDSKMTMRPPRSPVARYVPSSLNSTAEIRSSAHAWRGAARDERAARCGTQPSGDPGAARPRPQQRARRAQGGRAPSAVSSDGSRSPKIWRKCHCGGPCAMGRSIRAVAPARPSTLGTNLRLRSLLR